MIVIHGIKNAPAFTSFCEHNAAIDYKQYSDTILGCAYPLLQTQTVSIKMHK